MKVTILEAAYADLDRIHVRIKRDNPSSADSVIERIGEAITGNLTTFPYLRRRGSAPQIREWVVPGLPYIIIYRVDARSSELIVLAIQHGAQDR